MNHDVFVTLEHMHSVPAFSSRPGFCHKGARALCLRYNISWSQIIEDGGISSSVLESTGDALALHLVAHVKKLEQNISEQQNG